jgi:hypothetical protein
MTFLELFKFGFFPKYDQDILYLAGIAQREEWDFSDAPVKKYSILKNYLEHTFRRVKEQKKLAFSLNNEIASFNTGLVTENLEDIYAFFQKNKIPGHSPYVFKAWLKKSDNRLLSHFSHSFPVVADYFDRPELLLFDPRCEIVPDLDHIIQDNLTRFPTHLQIADAGELRRQIIGSIEETKKKVRSNYKVAVPQYFGGKIQLLLPLSLTSGSPNPDLALVVHRLNDRTYTARTCLTLKMAYNNARLIVQPQSNWLKP